MADQSKSKIDSVVPIALLMLAALVIGAAFVWSSAVAQDEIGQHDALEAVRQALAEEIEQITLVADGHPHGSESLAASIAGAHLQELHGLELVLVADEEGRTIAWRVGRDPIPAPDAAQMLTPALRVLVDRARSPPAVEPATSTGFVPWRGQIALVAARPLAEPAPGAVVPAAGPPATAVLARPLTPAYLDRIADRLPLRDLRLLPAGPPAEAGVLLPIRGPDGSRLGSLVWRTDRPVRDFLSEIAPVVAISVSVILACAAFVLGHTRRVAAALKASERRFRDVADASSDCIWETNREHRLSYLSGSFADPGGPALEQRCGLPFDQLFRLADGAGQPEPRLASWRPFRNVLCRLDDPRGCARTVRVSGKPVFDAAGRPTGFRGTATDITAEIEAGRRADFLALHDPLTGLANRSLLNDRLGQVIASVSRRGDHAALLLVDMNRFKDVNETLGHPVGDRLLQICADRLRACVREGDTVARIGGDEFAVVQTAIARPADASRVCERILRVFEEPFELNGQQVPVSVSIGCALIPDDGSIPETLLKKADIALERAKEDGRNAFRFFEAEMDARLRRRKTLEHDLRLALARDELELHFQPKITLGDNRLAGVEALVRWNHPERGLIPPAEFVGVTEETGLIVALGEWVLREACRRACGWPDLHVAVNISPVQFRRSDLVGLVTRVLAETGLPPGRLELEITENVLIGRPAAAAELLRALKQLGVRIAVDDFGTGYSSLSYLHRFPFDKIKLDRSFISMLGAEPAADAVVRAVIRIARDLGMSTCAEGVETGDQREMLVAEGCDEAQGFLFGRPMAGPAFEAFLDAWPGTGQDPKMATAAA